MTRNLLLISLLLSGSMGCASATREPMSVSANPVARASCGEALRTSKDVWTVEGFGGPGDTQLMMTAKRPVTRCPGASGAATGATLGAQQ